MEASSSSSSSTMYDVPTTLLGSFQNPFGHGSKKIMANGVPNCQRFVMVIAIWNLVMLKAPYVSEEEIIKVCFLLDKFYCVFDVPKGTRPDELYYELSSKR
jgi:hypothetical protein